MVSWRRLPVARWRPSAITSARGCYPAPQRSEGNYRLYLPEHVERLTFIRNCRTLDMTLDEIRELLSLRGRPAENCEAINTLIDEHIEPVSYTHLTLPTTPYV